MAPMNATRRRNQRPMEVGFRGPTKRKTDGFLSLRALRILTRFALALSCATNAWAQDQSRDLTERSLEDLMNIEVTSVSKKEQKLSRTAAAIFVITREDIRRSGATNIPDLLRMVPGMEIAQINNDTWAISARGLNQEFANELLVLVDGRNVYTPTFGGVFWDAVDVPLEDIERIEVIRGPGGSIWGANAVNGVVNIITQKASETKGALVSGAAGNLEDGLGILQYGSTLGKDTDIRFFAKYHDESSLTSLTGENGGDGWHALRGGFRADTVLSAKDALMTQGDIFLQREGGPVSILPSVTSPGPLNIEAQQNQSGGFFQFVWNHKFSDTSETSLNLSYTGYDIEDIIATLKEGRKTVSADFQDHIAWGSRNDVVWGGSYSYSNSHSIGNLSVSLTPPNRAIQVFSTFVQDEIALIPDRLFLTAGAKLEHNYYSGFGLMPSARVSYPFSKRQTVWAAVSRALRTPDSLDTGIRFNLGSSPGPGGTPILTSLFGNPHFKDESLVAYEFGYRTTLSDRVSIDLAAFYNDYDHQQTVEPAAPFPESQPAPAHIVMPSTYRNLARGEEHGIELAANWKLTSRWTLSPGCDFARIHLHTLPGSQDTQTVPETEGSDPHVHAQLRSHFELSRRIHWDTSAYFTGRLFFQKVPSYARLDTNLSWRLREKISLSVVGQNLLESHHLEFEEAIGGQGSTRIARSAYASLAWRF